MVKRIAAISLLVLLLGCPPPSMPASPAERAAGNVAPLQSGVALVVVLDTSGSMAENGRLSTVQKIWADTLAPKLRAYQTLTGRLEISLVQCGGSAGVICPVTSDTDAVNSIVAGLGCGGGTPLGSAMAAAYQQVINCSRERKHIFVLTDGAADAGNSPRPVLDAMRDRQEGISVYLIGFQSDRGNYADFEQTGGRVLTVDAADELDQACSDIFTDILKPEAE